MPVQEIHARSLSKSAALSSIQMAKAISPYDVIRVLNQAKISFVLVGAYGLAGWRKEKRGTEDVDVVVAVKQLKKAVKELTAAFPVEPVDLPVVIRLKEQGTDDVLIDVMKPLQQPYREIFKHTQSVTSEGETYRIPSLEMALAMKFSAMTSLYRGRDDKIRDTYDFMKMVKNNPQLDLEKLATLASLIYPEGGKDALELVRKMLSDEPIQI